MIISGANSSGQCVEHAASPTTLDTLRYQTVLQSAKYESKVGILQNL